MLGRASDMSKDKLYRVEEAAPVHAFLCTDMSQKQIFVYIPHDMLTKSTSAAPPPTQAR